MSTSSVSYTVPSNGWTGSIDVTDCDLSTDISVEDYRIFYDGVEQGTSELANWSKVSVTSLSYSGSSLNQNDVVRIERSTPKTQIATVLPFQTISSGAWNAEFTRLYNIMEEIVTYGINSDEITISDETYGSGWNGVTSQAPSKNAIYDKIESLALIDDEAYGVSWNGVADEAPSKNAVYDVVSATITQVNTNISNISANRNVAHMSGRLTVTTGTPVVTSTASSSTLYYTPYNGTLIYLYDGSAWNPYTLSEISLALSGLTDNRPHDIWIYDNAGTPTLEPLAWTNDTTRATALTLQNGVLVKSGQVTRRYVGTIVPVSNTINQGGTTVSSNSGFRNDVYNYYNKVAGSYRNSQGLTPATSNTAWYTNQLVTVVNGYYDEFNWSMTLSVSGHHTTATNILRIYTYDVNTSAVDTQCSIYVPASGASNANGNSVTTFWTPARQLGKAVGQALNSTGNASWSIESSRVDVSFCY